MPLLQQAEEDFQNQADSYAESAELQQATTDPVSDPSAQIDANSQLQQEFDTQQTALSDPANQVTTQPVAMEAEVGDPIMPGAQPGGPSVGPDDNLIPPVGDPPVDENGLPTDPYNLPPGYTTGPNGEILDQYGNPPGTNYLDDAGTTVEDLYPEDPGVIAPEAGTVVDPTGAVVTGSNLDEGNVGVGAGAEASTGVLGQGEGIDAATTDLTPEQQVDAELARILGNDSPLLAQARAQAAQQANKRGLLNTSMAAGMSQQAMVEAALPMAQQNAQQAAARELANTQSEQEAGMFSADQLNDLKALEAQLGTDVSMFNEEQLNEALRLQSELRSAMEQGNAEAMNDAALQLAELTRDAQSQQADLDYQASAEHAAARNKMNETITNNIAAMNNQYLKNLGNADIAIINNTYSLLIKQNEVAAGIYNKMLDGMAEIMGNNKISPAEAATKIRKLQETLEASLRMLQALNNPAGSGGGIGEGGDFGGSTNPNTQQTPNDNTYDDDGYGPGYGENP